MPTTVSADCGMPWTIRQVVAKHVKTLPEEEDVCVNFFWIVDLQYLYDIRTEELPHYLCLPGLHLELAVQTYCAASQAVKIHLHACDSVAGECKPRSSRGKLNLPSNVELLASASIYAVNTAQYELELVESFSEWEVTETDNVLFDCSRPEPRNLVVHLNLRTVTLDDDDAESLPQVTFTDCAVQTDPPVRPRTSDQRIQTGPVLSEPRLSLGERIRDNTDDADVVFVVDAEKIPAHSLVLSANSPAFRTMLRSEMTEAKEREVVLEDVCPDALQLFLDLLYTGAVDQEELEPHLWTVMMLADKYLVEWVQEVCAEVALNALTTENALDTLEELHKHRAPQTAIDDAVKYVVKRRRKTLATLTELDWQELDPKVAAQLSKRLAQL